MAKITGVCDTRCQLFQKEMIKKENTLRMKWFLKNQQRLIDHLKEPKFIKRAKEVIVESKKRGEARVDKSIVQRKCLPPWRPPTSDGSINIDIMKPIDPYIRYMLYEKEILTFITTNNYLTEKYKESPEKRFYFPECINWVYGWHLDHYSPVPVSKIGRKSIMLAEFYHRNIFNLQRDPEWYRGCQMKNAKNLNELSIY